MPENHNNPLPPLRFTAAAAVTVTSTAMSTMNGEGNEEEEEEDHFDRLPDAIIVVIFSKVSHAKYLFRCFAVCKRFASLLPQTDTVFFPIVSRENHNPISVRFQNIVNLPLRILHRIVPSWSSPPPSSSSPSSIAFDDLVCAGVGLLKFNGVRSLRLEWDWHPQSSFEDLNAYGGYLKSKAVMGARLEMAVFISRLELNIPKILQRFLRTTVPIDALAEPVEKRYLNSIKIKLLGFLSHHQWAHFLTSHLPALDDLVIDDKYFGKLCMGKEQIVELRNSGIARWVKSELIGGTGVGVKMTLHPLELPSKWAIVAVVKPHDDEEIVIERDVRLMLGACERDNEDDDNGKANAIDEVVNVVREKILSDPHGRSSIKTHRLNLLED